MILMFARAVLSKFYLMEPYLRLAASESLKENHNICGDVYSFWVEITISSSGNAAMTA